MADIRQGRAIELDGSTPNERISYLVRTLFKGKQREAARAFGISQAVLSKIVRNEQVVGQRVLAAVAAHPRVNAHWLYTGEGAPLVPEEGESPDPSPSDQPPAAVGPTLPVASQYLPGPPKDFPLLLTRMRMSVAQPDFRETRYWLGVTENTPVVHAKGEKIAAGDYLLMESGRRVWTDYPPVLNGRLMVVRLGGGRGPELVLARAGSEPEGGHLPLDTFGTEKRIVKLALKAPAQVGSSPNVGRQGKAIDMSDATDMPKAASAADTPTPHSSPVEAPESRPSGPSRKKADVVICLDDIVSVCVMLIRT